MNTHETRGGRVIVPQVRDLVWPTLKALKALGGSATREELFEEIVKREGFSAEILEVMHSDGRQPRVQYYYSWGLTALRHGGAVANSARGVWAITPYGETLDEAATVALNTRIQKEMQARPKKKEREESPEELKEERVWKDILLTAIRNMPPDAFERLAQRLLRESGFIKVEVTGRSGDGGIDGIGALRVNDLLSFKVFFQCKRYSGGVGSKEIRDFIGAMVGRGDKGIFITTGAFTAAAQQEARRDGVPVIDLIDGEQLCELLKKLSLGVSTRMVEEVSVDEAWFGQFDKREGWEEKREE